ncbi:hypothetical protein D3C80_1778900 [compost metagenome]
MVLNANALALDFTGTVATLVDQHPQHTAAADLLQIPDLAWLNGFHGACQPGNRRQRQQHRQAQQ